MNVLRLFAYRQNFDEIHATAHESPGYFVRLYVLLTLVTSATGSAWWYYYQMKAAPDLSPVGFFIMACLANYLGLLFLATMVSWGLARQSRKSWGVALPEEGRLAFFRPGVWAGLTIGLLYSFPLWVVGLALIAAHVRTGFGVQGISGLVAFIYGIKAVRDLYGVPRKRYLYLFVVSPLLIVALIGIVLAIAIPQWLNYERLVEAAQAHASPVSERTKISPLAQLRRDDASCTGGLPLRLPLHVSRWYAGTVVGFMPRLLALSIVFRSEAQVHGTLEPAYMSNQRVFIHPAHLGPRARFIAVVPAGLSVRLGERVRVAGARASHRFACQYIPSLVMP